MHAQSHHKKKHIQFSKHDKFDAILLEISLVTDNIFLLFLNHYIPPNNMYNLPHLQIWMPFNLMFPSDFPTWSSVIFFTDSTLK